MDTAVKLTEDLIDTVKAEYERFKQNPTYGRGYQRGYQDYVSFNEDKKMVDAERLF